MLIRQHVSFIVRISSFNTVYVTRNTFYLPNIKPHTIQHRVSVLKKVEAALPDVAVQSAGPRFNSQGEILPYSILGPVEQYQTAMIANGNVVGVFFGS